MRLPRGWPTGGWWGPGRAVLPPGRAPAAAPPGCCALAAPSLLTTPPPNPGSSGAPQPSPCVRKACPAQVARVLLRPWSDARGPAQVRSFPGAPGGGADTGAWWGAAGTMDVCRTRVGRLGASRGAAQAPRPGWLGGSNAPGRGQLGGAPGRGQQGGLRAGGSSPPCHNHSRLRWQGPEAPGASGGPHRAAGTPGPRAWAPHRHVLSGSAGNRPPSGPRGTTAPAWSTPFPCGFP